MLIPTHIVTIRGHKSPTIKSHGKGWRFVYSEAKDKTAIILGPEGKTEAEAVRLWNQRHGNHPQEVLEDAE